MSTQENYSINAAAKLTGYSIPTIRKRLPALKKARAKLSDGVWQIPLSALHTVGLMDKVVGGNISSKANDDEVETLRARIGELEAIAQAFGQRAAIAEAVANERGEALADMRNAMRQLEGRGPRKRWSLFS